MAAVPASKPGPRFACQIDEFLERVFWIQKIPDLRFTSSGTASKQKSKNKKTRQMTGGFSFNFKCGGLSLALRDMNNQSIHIAVHLDLAGQA